MIQKLLKSSSTRNYTYYRTLWKSFYFNDIKLVREDSNVRRYNTVSQWGCGKIC